MLSSTAKNCTMCNRSDAQFCGKCRSILYCSRACQQRDWPVHKLLCSTFSNFDTSSRPSDEHFRAIFFPVDDGKPQFVWLRCDTRMFEGTKCQFSDVLPFLGLGPKNRDQARPSEIRMNPVLGRELTDLIYIHYRDNFLNDGSKVNKSVAKISATKPGEYPHWRGPIIADGIVGTQCIQNITCRDLDMTDFRHIVDYFQSYSFESPPLRVSNLNAISAYFIKNEVELNKPTSNIMGVRINCKGDRYKLNRPFFEAVEVPPTDLIFSSPDTACDIAKCIDLPIFTRRYFPKPVWREDKVNYDNIPATFLHLCCNPNAGFNYPHKGILGWGWAPMHWQDYVGSILVVRQDYKPLYLWHVEALCSYCQDVLQNLFEISIEENSGESRDAVFAKLNKDAFSRFYREFLRQKQESGENLNVTDPYDV